MWAPLVALTIYAGWFNRDTLVSYLARANYANLLVAFIFYLGALSVVILGWCLIMRPFAGTIGWRTHLIIYGATNAARRLPGTIWYIGGRLVLYHRLGVSSTLISVASGIELVVSLVSGLVVGLALLPFSPNVPIEVVVVLIVGILMGVVALHPRVLSWLMRRIGKPMTKGVRWWDAFLWLNAYAGMWLLSGAMLVEIVSAFQSLGVPEVIYVVAAWSLSGAVGLLTFFLPSTFGATELTLAVLLSRIMPTTLAVAISVLVRILTTAFEVSVAAVMYPLLRRSKHLNISDATE